MKTKTKNQLLAFIIGYITGLAIMISINQLEIYKGFFIIKILLIALVIVFLSKEDINKI